MFKGRKLVIATMHGKESVIAPILEDELGVICFLPTDFDTDSLGTFSGEIERINDPVTTVIEKCKKAMRLSNCDLGIASEGSFGNHPSIFFATADDEFLVFIDLKNNLEIIARNLSLETNFASEKISNLTDLKRFVTKVQFPSHGIIVKDREQKPNIIYKNNSNYKDLETAFLEIAKNQSEIFVETDMRAMHNPTRMKVIQETTKILVEKIKTNCPECKTPGFEVVKVISGLRCENCNMPTRSAKMQLFKCKKCTFEEMKKIPNNKEYEDPMYCDFCNP